jgi:cytochrome c oxidase subunit 2
VIPWGASSSLDPAGPQAGHIASVWWLFLAVCTVVYASVLVALALALTRRPGTIELRRRARVVGAAVALTVVTLLALLGRSVVAGKALTAMAGTATVDVKVIGRQWWWELQYQAQPPSQIVITANELHIPVGQPVLLELESRDVIHSFWVPALHGKRDLIPGHPSATYVRADRPGLYRGQCAEFCGAQHAHMGLTVIAEAPADFQAWLNRMRQPAPEPATPRALRGRELFMRGPCVMCHAVAGTIAAAGAGPDLTHLGARRTLAAGTLPNRRDALAAWIRDAQTLKPGAHMPTLGLAPRDVEDLLAYLETLR